MLSLDLPFLLQKFNSLGMDYILNGLSYVRGPIATVVGVLWTFFISVLVILVATVTSSPRPIDFISIHLWARFILWMSGVELEVRGRENVQPGGKGFLILFNHSSNFDIPALFLFPRSFRFGAKVELFKIPFFGRAMAMCGVLPIDRGNRNKVMRVYDSAISRIEQGECFALAPEGTRQNEPKIGTFKRGPFDFALNAKADLVPVVLAGVYEVLPKKAFLVNTGKWKRKVIMEILPRVPTHGLTAEQLDPVVQKVRDEVEAVFSRNHAEVMSATAPG